ncbi:MAG: tyrosine-type recombinase/integrase [Bacilli bacterium]|nr:tyrosine-type recombinase/integrase [Bacilli bacterium]
MKKKDLEDNIDIFINEQYLNELSINSQKAYRNSINKFIEYLNKKEILIIDKKVMIDYRKYLDTISESANSKNLWIIALNKYLKWFDCTDLCLHQIKVQRKFYADYNLSLADYKRLLRIAKKEGREQDYYIIKTLCMTGIRISELKFFTVENLKRQNNNILHIYNKKKERDILLIDELARDLRKYCRKSKIYEGYIFKSPKIEGNMISTSCIWKHLQKIAGIARVNKKVVHAHSFRHLFSDVFLDKYPDHVLALAAYLGHNSLETTRIYAKKTLKQQKQMLSKLDF